MKKLRVMVIIILLIAIFILTGYSIVSVQAKSPTSNLIKIIIPSTALQGNLFKDPTSQPAYIYLPPSYDNSQKQYPVVYFLHGFDESPFEISQFRSSLDSLIKKGQINEMIFVGVNGNNKLNGSFYVNSPVTGNWEDYVVKDVVSYIDSNYRTLANSASRGIAGFSMGGFGAFNLSFKHPDIFSVVYCLSPGLFDSSGLNDAMGQWDLSIKSAYGAAFSPNTQKPSPYADIPELNIADDVNNAIKSNWENGFGNLQGKINDYLALGKPLKAIRIEYGLNEYYRWIPNGCKYLSKLLTEKGIAHDLLTFQGGHEIIVSVLSKDMFPFLSNNLESTN